MLQKYAYSNCIYIYSDLQKDRLSPENALTKRCITAFGLGLVRVPFPARGLASSFPLD